MWQKILRKRSIAEFVEGNKKFEQVLSGKDLVLFGVGIVIGSSIFILPGTVSALTTGPSIVLSFIIAAIISCISGLCFAELASEIPASGSAYTYGNVIFGEIIGWLLGWSLFMEYLLSIAAVATGWAAYFNSFLAGFNIHIAKAFTGSYNPGLGTYINIFAILIILIICGIIALGTRSSTRINEILVYVKLVMVIAFIIIVAFYVKPDNWIPFMPYGWSGVLQGASIVFFAYVGFDGVAATAAEVKNPQKNLPIGILGTLLVCTLLYVMVSAVMTGAINYHDLNVGDPMAFVLKRLNLNWIAGIVTVGALLAMFTSMVSMTFASSRLVYSIGRDGLLPTTLSKINHKRNVPLNALIAVTIVVAIFAGLMPLEQLASLVNIGTLIVFLFVSIGTILLRRQNRNQGNGHQGFKIPFYPVLPLLSAFFCILLLSQIDTRTWLIAIAWYVIGLIIYFGYGYRHAK